MEQIIITTGERYTDIDGLACCLAYRELLELKGQKAEVILPGPLNHSVTQTIRGWGLKYKTKPGGQDAKIVVMDVSNPDQIAAFVKPENIAELYDHHVGHGYSQHWKEKLGTKAKLEPVGACATLVWEEFVKSNKTAEISATAANLIYTAIISNTLNFAASVTDKRDIEAAGVLKKFTDLPENWIEQYFIEQESAINSNVAQAILNDTKPWSFPNLKPDLVIGQIELWDSRSFIKNHRKEIKSALESFKNPNWFLTSPSISENRNYIYTESKKLQEILARFMGAEFKEDIGTTKKLWLRKEIIKKLRN